MNFNRELSFLNNIIFLDGGSGAGKSVLNSLLPCFENVEIPIWDSFYENLSVLYENGKLEDDAAIAVIRTAAETSRYDALVGRHTNFRFKDSSSIFHNPGTVENIKRSIAKDGDSIIDKIKDKKIILTIGSHYISSSPTLIHKAFKKKLKLIEMVRHPSSLILFWMKKRWVNRLGVDPRDISLWINYNQKSLPWFVKGYESDFIQMNDIEKIINSLNWIDSYRRDKIKKLSNSLFVIPFENFVTKPFLYVEKISRFISKHPSSKIKKYLKKVNCPRVLNSSFIKNQKNEILNLKMNKKTKNIFKKLCENYDNNLQNDWEKI